MDPSPPFKEPEGAPAEPGGLEGAAAAGSASPNPVATSPRSRGEGPAAQSEPIVMLRKITKRFPGVLANDKIDLDIHGGEVHAILGENGAGKSTLMKILYGFYQPDSGEFFIDGAPVTIRTPQDARRRRIGMVFQSFTLVHAMTVVENVALFLPDLKPILDLKSIAGRIMEVSRRYGLQVDPKTPVWQLSIGEKQKVELLKLLMADARVLIFDEPTSVLAPHEIQGLFTVFDKLRSDGYAIVFITHKLPEVMGIADRITVLRRGALVDTVPREGATESQLVHMMFGSTPAEAKPARAASPPDGATPLMELRGVSTSSPTRDVNVNDVSLKIMPGEIVGIAGVSGSGQTELGEAIMGLEACSQGIKLCNGQDATRWPVSKFRKHGVSFIPEDPERTGVVPDMTVQENMPLSDRTAHTTLYGLALAWNVIRANTERFLRNFGLRIPPLDVRVRTLSGGNMQRVVLARELSRSPKLVIAFHPTRGLDVPSAIATRDLLTTARDSGVGVLLVSEDLNELFALSDRLVVMYRGELVGEFKPGETTTLEIGHLMTGSKAA